MCTIFLFAAAAPAGAQGSFATVGPMAGARGLHTATPLQTDGKVLIAGGEDKMGSFEALASAEVFDPATGLFTPTANPMSEGRSEHTATIINGGKVLLVGGETQACCRYNGNYGARPRASADIYDQATNSFSPAGPMTTARYEHAAVKLANGRVLVTGGIVDMEFTQTASAEIYDPATNTFSPAGSMTMARADHSMVMLPNGRILIVGGSGAARTTAEIYDPSANTFTATLGAPTQNEAGAALFRQADGTVLVIGAGTAIERYTPATQTFTTAGATLYSYGYHATVVRLDDGRIFLADNGHSEIYNPVTNTSVSTGPYGTGSLFTAGAMSFNKVLVTGGETFVPYTFVSSAAASLLTPNASPIAVAGPNQTLAPGASCLAPITLDGSASSDPDGDALTYEWKEGTTVVGTSPAVAVSVTRGVHVYTLTVTDTFGATSTAAVTITVQDTMPPSFVTPLPVTLTQAGPNGTVYSPSIPVATDNCDPSPIVTISGVPAGNLFPAGTTSITYTATDIDNNSASSTTTVTVVAAPTTTVLTSAPNPSQFGDAATFTATVRAAALPVLPGEIGHWTFDDAAGATLALDSSANAHHALCGAACPVFGAAGIFRDAATFDGTQYLHVPNNVAGTSTISAWIKTTDVGGSSTDAPAYTGRGIIWSDVGGPAADMIPMAVVAGHLAFGTGENNGRPYDTLTSSMAINTGTWVHVVVTRDAATGAKQLYVNGVLDRTSTGATGSLSANTQIAFGANVLDNRYFSGALDDVHFYDRVLTAADIGALYTGGPTGTVSFGDGGTTAGSGTIGAGGLATFTTSTLSVGAHELTASFAGSAAYAASASEPLTQTVTRATTSTSVTAAPNTSVYGQAVTFTASVASAAGTPTGTVTFTDGTQPLGTASVAGGVATLTVPMLNAGTHAIAAGYSGDEQFAASAAVLSQIVSPAPLVVTANSVSRPFNAANPAFTVTFTGFQGGDTPGVLSGSLVFATSAMATSLPGTYAIVPSSVSSPNYAISFVPGTLTIVAVPPIASDDAASTLESTPVTIAVLANDSDLQQQVLGGPLTVTIATAPAHGAAAVTASQQVIYSPAAGFAGTDTFTYTFADAYGLVSAPATVVVKVNRLGRFVVLSRTSTTLMPNVTVLAGDVGAAARRRDGDRDDVTVRLQPGVRLAQPGSRVVGDVVELQPKASVYDVVSNTLVDRHADIRGVRTTSMAVPFVALPAMPTVTPGTAAVTVAKNRTLTLAPGQYGAVRVSDGATLVLRGGVYELKSLDVENGATVLFTAAVEIRIAGDLDVDSRAKLAIDPAAAGVRAASVVVYVGGREAAFGDRSTVQANVYAPNGTVSFGPDAQATGAFIGAAVTAGPGTTFSLDSAFQ